MPLTKSASRVARHRLQCSLRWNGWRGTPGLACAEAQHCSALYMGMQAATNWARAVGVGPYQRMQGLRAVGFCLAA